MLWDGCLVRVDGPDVNESKTEDRTFFITEEGITTLSASGVIFENGTILVSGNTLSPYLTSMRPRSAKLVKGTKVLVSMEIQNNKTHEQDAKWYSTEFIGVVSVGRDCIQAASRLINVNDLKKLESTGFAMVGVLKIRKPQAFTFPEQLNDYSNKNVDNNRFITNDDDERNLQRGDPLTIISSPFGLVSPKVFRNSLSSGTLSNVIYQRGIDKPSLLLTDAVIHAGGEGGGVADANGHLIGLIAPTLVRDTKVGLEFTCILPIHSCWRSMSRRGWVKPQRPVFYRSFPMNRLSRNLVAGFSTMSKNNTSIFTDFNNNNHNHNNNNNNNNNNNEIILKSIRDGVMRAEKSLVCLRVGKSWASGILLDDQGYILTCAHLLKPFLRNNSQTELNTGYNVSVRCDGSFIGIWQDAEIIYVCDKTIDIAVVKLADVPLGAKPIVFAPGDIIRGQAGTILGHALFEPSLEIRPSVSKGVISNVTYYSNQEAIVQSSACVYRGDSGGMLLDQHGRLIGMVTSNARQADGSIIPRINFSVPKNILRPLAKSNELIAYMKSLDEIDDDLQALWNLEDVEEEPNLSHEENIILSKL